MDSALGRHFADFGDFRATADLKSSSTLKSPKNYKSPTANPRILEEGKHAQSLESTFIVIARLAARQVVAIHNQKRKKWILALCHCERVSLFLSLRDLR